jgi:phosphoribosylaminoimidazole (AIR) synthetase
VFGWLEDEGGVSENEMIKKFKCGIGEIIIVSE